MTRSSRVRRSTQLALTLQVTVRQLLLGFPGLVSPGFAPAGLVFTLTQRDLVEAARILHQPEGLLPIIAGAALLLAAGRRG